MSLRVLSAVLGGALVVAAFVGSSGAANAGNATCRGAAGNGYAYAGHQASQRVHGVRATITATRAPEVAAGHVSGWIGVGGPGLGANGEDAWIQVGIAATHGVDEPFLYAEIVRGGRHPQFILLENGVEVGETRTLAVVEAAGRPSWWHVLVDGRSATKPVRLAGSSGRWAPIATAESWNGGEPVCNRFAYRFERVSIAHGRGESWEPFVSAHRFLDRGYRLRTLATTAPTGSRSLAGSRPLPYAFVAVSG